MRSLGKYPTTPMCSGELLERFEPTVRPTDVFTATIAKCGQTWLCALLYHLKTRGRCPDFEGKGLMRVVPWLEIPWDPASKDSPPFDLDERLAELEAMGDPRIFKMHVVWEEIPRSQRSASKVITITRDPRDVPYSMYCHLEALQSGPFGDSPPPFEEYFETWMEFGFYFRFVESFWPHRDDPGVLWLRYEDLTEDLAREAQKIVEFLGWDVSAGDLERALPLVSFDRMRRKERTAALPGSTSFRSDRRFFREGGVGKNREKLSPEMEARIVDRIRHSFAPECADFLLAQG